MDTKMELPKRFLPALLTLRNIGREGVAELAELLSAQSRVLSPAAISKLFSAKLGEQADLLAECVVSISLAGRRSSISPDRLVSDLSHAVRTVDPPWSDSELEAWSLLEEPLKRLFALDALGATVKATDLQFGYENICTDVRIITDIRPVFDSTAKSALAALVCHTFHVGYRRTSGETENVSVALENSDIRRIIKICERALVKADTIEKYLCAPKPLTAIIPGDDESQSLDG
jgi:hypothetical protein